MCSVVSGKLGTDYRCMVSTLVSANGSLQQICSTLVAPKKVDKVQRCGVPRYMLLVALSRSRTNLNSDCTIQPGSG